MPNQITAAGLETKTRAELITEDTAALEAIYGADIDLASDTPDGQVQGIRVQAALDQLDLVTQVYNGMDPDQAIGRTLDQRVAVNGIQRQAGTYTLTPITITVDESLSLVGIDDSPDDPYTVADDQGNKWQLLSTQNPVAAGDYIYDFRAATPGAIPTIPNTITVPVSVVLGVTAINNPTIYTSLGITEETDPELRLRRQESVSLASLGFNPALRAALKNIDGITDAFVKENVSGSTDANGIPSHSIWVIVAGTAPAAQIAQAIYDKRNAGCGMKGSVSYTILQSDGTPFVVRWDVVQPENLYIAFTATSLDGVNLPNTAAILAGLPSIYTPGVNGQVNINQLATLVEEIDANTLVTVTGTSEGFSLTGVAATYVNVLSPSALNKQFAISAGNINITVTPLP